jgi:protein import protein ZIM17
MRSSPAIQLTQQESTEAGTLKTVEDLLRAKGETIKKGRVNMDGDIEYDPEAE